MTWFLMSYESHQTYQTPSYSLPLPRPLLGVQHFRHRQQPPPRPTKRPTKRLSRALHPEKGLRGCGHNLLAKGKSLGSPQVSFCVCHPIYFHQPGAVFFPNSNQFQKPCSAPRPKKQTTSPTSFPKTSKTPNKTKQTPPSPKPKPPEIPRVLPSLFPFAQAL